MRTIRFSPSFSTGNPRHSTAESVTSVERLPPEGRSSHAGTFFSKPRSARVTVILRPAHGYAFERKVPVTPAAAVLPEPQRVRILVREHDGQLRQLTASAAAGGELSEARCGANWSVEGSGGRDSARGAAVPRRPADCRQSGATDRYSSHERVQLKFSLSWHSGVS